MELPVSPRSGEEAVDELLHWERDDKGDCQRDSEKAQGITVQPFSVCPQESSPETEERREHTSPRHASSSIRKPR